MSRIGRGTEPRRYLPRIGSTEHALLFRATDKAEFGCYTSNQKRRMTELFARITVDPERMRGRPCIRNLRITVADVLGLLAAGQSRESILEDYPYLERQDILASIEYAAHQTSHSVLLSA